MIKRIVITGPESTGKSTLASELAMHYKTVFVPEVARAYIDLIQRPYIQNDLLEIAKLQRAEEDKLISQATKFLICDTDLQVIKVWSEFKYNTCDNWIIEELKSNKPDLYLVCNIDLPWQEDTQREHPNERQELFDIYHKELITMNANFEIITGQQSERTARSIKAINQFFGMQP